MILGNIVNIILYIIFAGGLGLLFMDSFTDLKYRVKVAHRMKNSPKSVSSSHEGNRGLRGRLFMLLKTTTKIKTQRAVDIYIIANIALGGILFLVVQAVVEPVIAMVAAGGSVCLPTAALRARLQTMRVTASREGEVLVTEILNYYKIHYFNMFEAIEQSGYNLQEAPRSKRFLMTLSNGLSTAASNSEIKKLLWDFNYSIGTSWAVILSNNMYFALTDGIKVTGALSDLTESITAARKAMEQNRRENNEAKLMLKYLIPASYIFTVVAANRFFGFTADKFIHYQFMTSTGLSWFMGCVGAFIISVIAMTFLSKTKMDL